MNEIITKAENKLVVCCAKTNNLILRSKEQTEKTIKQLMRTKWGRYAVAIPMMLSGLSLNVYAGTGDSGGGGDASSDANKILSEIMGALGPGVIALGTLVAVVGGIQLGKGFTRDDADSKASGMMTMIGGIIIGAVGGIVSTIKIDINSGGGGGGN